MNSESVEGRRTLAWLIVAAAGVRAAFGIIMAIDAYLKWQPTFAAHYVGYLQNATKGQPPWLAPWFNFWLRMVIQHTSFFVLATRLIETAIAIGLLLGLARRITYIAGALFSLLIWSTAEGFGGPYTAGATNLGPALVYALVFIAAALFERLLGSNPYSLDYYIGRRFPKWGTLVEWAPKRVWQRSSPTLNLDHQLASHAGERRRGGLTLKHCFHFTRCPRGSRYVAAFDRHRRHSSGDAQRNRCNGGNRERCPISGMDIRGHRTWTDSARPTGPNRKSHVYQQWQHDALDRSSCGPSRPERRLPLRQSRPES
jgi:uncharacterized membrane protein YphA (DoxX/SURF4 family)